MSWSVKAFLLIAVWVGLVALFSMFKKGRKPGDVYTGAAGEGESGGFAGDPGDGSVSGDTSGSE